MSDQPETPAGSPIIQLEILPEDEQQQDLGDVAETEQMMLDYLTRNGCTVAPVYTGRMGGSVYDVLVHAYHIIHSNEELLAAMFASLATILKLISEHNKPKKAEKSLLIPPQMSVEIGLPIKDGAVTIKAPDAETAIKLVEELRNTQPEKMKKITAQSKATIKVNVPKQKWQRQGKA